MRCFVLTYPDPFPAPSQRRHDEPDLHTKPDRPPLFRDIQAMIVQDFIHPDPFPAGDVSAYPWLPRVICLALLSRLPLLCLQAWLIEPPGIAIPISVDRLGPELIPRLRQL